MTSRSVVASLLGLLALTNLLIAADWPQFRGPNRDDISLEKGLLKTWPKDGPKLLWSYKEAGAGYGGLAISKGFIYLLGCEEPSSGTKEFALCLDEKTGKKVWQQDLKTADGKYNYQYGNGPRCTPTIDGDKLYILGAKGDLLCMNCKDGSTVWRKNLVGDFGGAIPTWGYSESPLIDGDHLIITPGGSKGAIVALDKKDGSKVWASTDLKDGAHYSSCILADVDGVKQYIQQTGASLVGVSAKDGKLLWKEQNLPRKIGVIPTPIYQDHYVFATAGYQAGCELIKLTSKNGKTKAEKVYAYANDLMVNHHGGVILLGDYIYGFSDKGNVWECIDYKKDTKTPVWSSKDLDKGSITYADGHFFLQGAKKGTCVMIEANPKAWVEQGRFEMPEHSKISKGGGGNFSHPIVSNGRLYLRDFDLLFCYDIAAGTN